MRNICLYLKFEPIRSIIVDSGTIENSFNDSTSLYYIYAGDEREVQKVRRFWKEHFFHDDIYEAMRTITSSGQRHSEVDGPHGMTIEAVPYLYWIEAKWMLQYILHEYGEGVYDEVCKMLEEKTRMLAYQFIATFHYSCEKPIFIERYRESEEAMLKRQKKVEEFYRKCDSDEYKPDPIDTGEDAEIIEAKDESVKESPNNITKDYTDYEEYIKATGFDKMEVIEEGS